MIAKHSPVIRAVVEDAFQRHAFDSNGVKAAANEVGLPANEVHESIDLFTTL